MQSGNAIKAQNNNLYCAATSVGGVLVVRWLARDALLLRNGYGKFLAAFRQHVAGLPPTLPRLWYVYFAPLKRVKIYKIRISIDVERHQR
ncbi:MAG TPA: hypothetical protein ENG03_03505 [Thioploca sp.]|nr:hypothetical protein [Thioploca sp.]